MATSSVDKTAISLQIGEIDKELELMEEEIRKLRQRKQKLVHQKSELLQQLEYEAESGSVQEKWENDNFTWSEKANQIRKETFNLPSFRPLQKAVINAVMSKEDTLVIMSTGGGKSLCYQLPAVLSEGLSLVVSPLVSLIEDQLRQLKALGVEAATLNQHSSKEEVKRIEAAITAKSSTFRLLYVTPEKLAKSKRIMNKLEKSLEIGFLKLIAVDEVHCCSQWGHDFRKDYAFLSILKRQFRGVPILGLTATATTRVLNDVKDMLSIPGALIFRAGFNRPNLFYEVIQKESVDITDEISQVINKRFKDQCGIVYCFSRKECEEVAQKLRKLGHKAQYYHAYLEQNSRSEVHDKWSSGKYNIIVATVAFGMGIDKPDVRFVIHHCIPKSIENYYQESGRAGRDGKQSTCIMFYRLADVFRQSTMVCTERTGVENLYSVMRYATNKKRCRRSMLASHFQESWSEADCQKMCDNCKDSALLEERDVKEILTIAAQSISDLRDAPGDGTGKMTGGKLVDVLMKKGKVSRSFAEEAIGFFLSEGFLEEDFHFTPYSIISYMQMGRRWSATCVAKMSTTSVGAPPKAKKSRPSKKVSDSDDDDDRDFVTLD